MEVKAEPGGEAEGDRGRGKGDGGAGFEEDAALGQAEVRQAVLGAAEHAKGDAEGATEGEAGAATHIDVERGNAGVERESVQGVDADREATCASVSKTDVGTYVEIVEYNDGDEPYTKSLGIFRPLTSHELEIKWGRHPDEKLDVKVFPGTWLTRVEFEHEAVPEHELGQMELGYYWP